MKNPEFQTIIYEYPSDHKIIVAYNETITNTGMYPYIHTLLKYPIKCLRESGFIKLTPPSNTFVFLQKICNSTMAHKI
jgi:hypothetical protein